MNLYIVRHAFAGQHGDPNYPDDALRPLTKKGRKSFARLIKRLARQKFAPAVVATSPLVRCKQTAEEICERIDPASHLVELDGLRPGSQLHPLVAWSNEQGYESLAWVGHAPDVDHLAAALLGCREGAIRFSKGAVASISFPDKIIVGHGELEWMIAPKVISR